MEGKTIFIQAGGHQFHYIPCLNERDDWIHALGDITLVNLQGWTDSGLADKKGSRRDEEAIALSQGDTSATDKSVGY
jgi:ferrochelatase